MMEFNQKYPKRQYFDESTDLRMTYLGKVDQTRKSIIRAEEKFSNFRTRAYARQTIRQN